MSPVLAIRLIFFLDGLIIAKWLPHLPDIQSALRLDVGQLGLALAALPLGILCSLPLIGPLVVGKFSERAGVRLTFSWLIATSTLPGLAWDLPTLALALFLFGTGVAGAEVSMNTTADAVESRLVRRIMSSCHGLWSVGNIAGAFVGGAGLMLALPAGQMLLTTAPIIAILTFVASSALGPQHSSEETGPAIALPSKSLLLLCMLPFCASVLEGSMADWAAVYLRSEYTSAPALTAAGFGIFATVMAVTRLAGDRLIDRFGPTRLALGCGLSGVVGLCVIGFAPNIGLALLGFGFMGLAASLIFPMSITAAARHPGRTPAHNIASLSLICFSGYVIGPPLVGALANTAGLRNALLCLLPMAIGIIILARRAKPAAGYIPSKTDDEHDLILAAEGYLAAAQGEPVTNEHPSFLRGWADDKSLKD